MDFLPRQIWSREDAPEKDEKEKKEKEPKSKLEEKFLETRTILLFGEISQKVAREVSEKLILLSAINDNDIKLIINSQGGHVEAGDTIHDMIRFVKPKVKILGTGWVASAGALIYVAVPVEQRFSLAKHPVHAAPAERRGGRPGDGHQHRGRGDSQDAPSAQSDFLGANRFSRWKRSSGIRTVISG